MTATVHRHQLRVRYAETDQMGVAHHGAWIAWLEEARIEWLRAQGRSYRQLEADGVFMPVIEVNVRYRQPARFDECLELETVGEVRPPSRMQFTTTIRREDTLLGEGTVTVAAVDRAGRPIRVPAISESRI